MESPTNNSPSTMFITFRKSVNNGKIAETPSSKLFTLSNSSSSSTNTTVSKYTKADSKLLYEDDDNSTGKDSFSWSQWCQCFKFLQRPKPLVNESPTQKALKRMLTELDLLNSCDIIGKSEIFNMMDVQYLSHHVPPQTIGEPWILKFSTSNDGFSLSTMYRRLYKVETLVFIFIQDVHDRIFGALASSTLKISDKFYGTSHSFLFTLRPLQIYKWNGCNFYFIECREDTLAFGCSNGKYGLWLDSDLHKGRTDECTTYGSPALVNEKDFIVKHLEAWSFKTHFG